MGADEEWRILKPTNFDLIVVGTGLTESIIAAAAAGAGKTVLQINPDQDYYSPTASLPPKELTSFLLLHSNSTSPIIQTNFNSNSSEEFNLLPLNTRPLYSSVQVNVYSPQILEDSLKRDFNLDLAGPKVLFCADPMIDLIIDAEINKYMSFISVDASFYIDHDDHWNNVPDSRNAIFKDRSLSFKEKNQLMRFFKVVQSHYYLNFATTGHKGEEYDIKISQEDLETPFVDFLTRKIGLSPKLNSIILYAIVMADYEQDNVEGSKTILKTKDGIDRLIFYHKSIGRFPDATGPVVYPIHGQGELAYFFCRRAAVMGGLSVTQMPVVGLLVDKYAGNYKGVKLVTGQDLFSHQLILAPSFIIPSELTPPSLGPQDGYYDFDLRDAKEKVVRGICITESSLKSDVANCLLFYPPRSLCQDQLTSVRIFQLSNNVNACPSGMFVVYLSTVCEDVFQAKKSLNAAIDALFSTPVYGNSEDNSRDPPREITVAKVKPTLLWSILYIQERIMGRFDRVYSTPMPDGNLQYNNVVDSAVKLFQKMYPDEEFFPKIISPWNEVAENDACSSD